MLVYFSVIVNQIKTEIEREFIPVRRKKFKLGSKLTFRIKQQNTNKKIINTAQNGRVQNEKFQQKKYPNRLLIVKPTKNT